IPRFLSAAELAEVFEAADVLVLPYLKNYGSGLLLLGMTFGTHIASTDSGGASEYLRKYPSHTLLEGAEPDQIAAGLRQALERIALTARGQAPEIAELQWTAIARDLLGKINHAP